MSQTSCIQNAPKDRLLLVHRWQLVLCQHIKVKFDELSEEKKNFSLANFLAEDLEVIQNLVNSQPEETFLKHPSLLNKVRSFTAEDSSHGWAVFTGEDEGMLKNLLDSKGMKDLSQKLVEKTLPADFTWEYDVSLTEEPCQQKLLKSKVVQCAATLLQFKIHFHDLKIAMQPKAKKSNDTAQQHGDERTHDESLLQWHTGEELDAALLGFFGETTISRALRLLKFSGLITCHRNPNPRFKYDRTTFYLLHPDKINYFITRYSDKKISKKPYDNDSVPVRNAFRINTESSPWENGMEAVPIRNGNRGNTETITKITAEITTKKTAAKETDLSALDNSLKASFPAAAFSQEDNATINETIGEKLTLAQIHGVKQKLSAMPLRLWDTVATLQHAVLTSLVDDTQFTACHPHFAKKLNAIAKCYRAGTYFPETVLAVKQQAQQAQKDQQAQQRLNDLREKYRQLAGDINHYETLLRANLTVDEAVEYAPIYAEKKRVLETMKHEIDVLKRQLGQNTNNLSFPEKRVGIKQSNTALSTELLTKIVNNSAGDNGHVDSKSLGEGGC